MTLDPAKIIEVFFIALQGLPVTLFMVVVSILIALPFGFIMAVINVRNVPIASQACRVYISFMRGVPIIVQIFLIYNSLPSLLNVVFSTLGIPFDVFAVSTVFYAIVVFSLSEIAILAEVFRAAINGIDEGQLEAAESAGLTLTQSYVRIIVPQAFGAAIPVLGNAVTDLIKTTSLAFSMAIADVMGIAKVEAAASLDYIDSYLAVFFIYLILVLIFENLFKVLDKKLNFHKRTEADRKPRTLRVPRLQKAAHATRKEHP